MENENKNYKTLWELFDGHCDAINEDTDLNLNVTYNGNCEYGYYRIFNGDVELTGGDWYDTEMRLLQIIRENGIDIINLVRAETLI